MPIAPGGFMNRTPRLAGTPALQHDKLDFSLGPEGGREPLEQLLPMMFQSMLAAGGTQNVAGGGPTDVFRAANAGQQRVAQIRTDLAEKERQKRADELEDIDVQNKLAEMGRPVVGGMVEEEHALGEITGDSGIQTMMGETVKAGRPPDKSRTVRYKTLDGKTLEYEMYTPQEKKKMAIAAASAAKQAEEAAKIAAKVEEQRQLQKLGVTPDVIAGINQQGRVAAAQTTADAAAERAKQAAEDAAGRAAVRAEEEEWRQAREQAFRAEESERNRESRETESKLNREAREAERNRVPTPAQEASEIRVGTELAKARARAVGKEARQSQHDDLVDAVMGNPNYYQDLTPTARTAIGPDLVKKGFRGFGKTLSSTEINKMADQKFAVKSLEDLRDTLKENEQYIGPLAGIQALNPYSEGRKAQADIDRVKQRVGKILEGGVLRKEDEDKYTRILATLRDEPSTALYKVDQMIESFGNDAAIYLEELRKAGRRVGDQPAPTTSGGASSGAPKATKRWNPKTQKLEAIQ